MKAWDAAGRKKRMCTAHPNWAAMSTKLRSNKADSYRVCTSHLDHIFEVDEQAMTITCEPSVNMGDLKFFSLPRGLALLCQVEMESLTIGGFSMGIGMEINSHNLGFVCETPHSDSYVVNTKLSSYNTVYLVTMQSVDRCATQPKPTVHYIHYYLVS